MPVTNVIQHMVGISIIVHLCLPLAVNGSVKNNAFDLHEDLLKYYDTDAVPRKDSEIINVNITFNLMALLRYDAAEETLLTAAWLSIRWNDYLLKWDENSKYDNITETFLQQRKVWKPDLRLVNTVETHKTLGSEELLVKVNRNGNVLWEPGHRFKTSCSLDTRMYPFDNQKCSLVFSTWMHLGNVVKLFSLYDEIRFDDFEENGEWKIIATTSESKYLHWDGYYLPRFIVTLTLQRRTLYYALTICVPILILSILNCLVYLLPPDSGEKISFCLTVLLAYMVYISFLSDNLPRTSKTTSYLVVYLSSMICLSFLSVFNSVLVLFFWHKTDVRDDDRYPNDDYGLICTTSSCMACVNRNGNTLKNKKSQTFSEIQVLDVSEDGDRKNKNMKIIANALDKIFCIAMVVLTLSTTAVITALILK